MPLEVLASIVVVGLGLVYAMMKVMKFDRQLRLSGADDVRAEWAADNPTAPAQEVIVALAGQAALVRSRRGWGVLWVMGIDTASHDLAGASVHPHKHGLKLKLHDFSAPSVVLTLTEDEIPVWRKKIEEVV